MRTIIRTTSRIYGNGKRSGSVGPIKSHVPQHLGDPAGFHDSGDLMSRRVGPHWKFSLLCLLVVACTTTPDPLAEMHRTPKARLMAFQTVSPENTSTVTLLRDTGVGGAACYLLVYVNATLAARMDAGELAQFFIPPGKLLLGVAPEHKGRGFCPVREGYSDQIDTTMKDHEEKRFRVLWYSDGTIWISPIGNLY